MTTVTPLALRNSRSTVPSAAELEQRRQAFVEWAGERLTTRHSRAHEAVLTAVPADAGRTYRKAVLHFMNHFKKRLGYFKTELKRREQVLISRYGAKLMDEIVPREEVHLLLKMIGKIEVSDLSREAAIVRIEEYARVYEAGLPSPDTPEVTIPEQRRPRPTGKRDRPRARRGATV